MSEVQASLLFIYFSGSAVGTLGLRSSGSQNHNLQEEISATPLVLIRNLVQETYKLQRDTPGCFLNPQQGLRGKSVIHPCVPLRG